MICASFAGVLPIFASPGSNLSDSHAENLDAGGAEELDERSLKDSAVVGGATLVEAVTFEGMEVSTSEAAVSWDLQEALVNVVLLEQRAPFRKQVA